MLRLWQDGKLQRWRRGCDYKALEQVLAEDPGNVMTKQNNNKKKMI